MPHDALTVTLSAEPDGIDWVRLADVFKRAPLGERRPELLQRVFANSTLVCFAFANGELIGAGRALSDRLNYAVIFDVVVLPEFQRRGIGKRIMEDLATRSGARNMMLHSAPGKEEFYKKIGYRRMKTAMARFANAEQQAQWGYIE